MKVICIKQNEGRKPRPKVGEVYDADMIKSDMDGAVFYKMKEFDVPYAEYWVRPLREYNLEELGV